MTWSVISPFICRGGVIVCIGLLPLVNIWFGVGECLEFFLPYVNGLHVGFTLMLNSLSIPLSYSGVKCGGVESYMQTLSVERVVMIGLLD